MIFHDIVRCQLTILGSVCTAQISLISGAAVVHKIIQRDAVLTAAFESSVDSMDLESEDEEEKELGKA